MTGPVTDGQFLQEGLKIIEKAQAEGVALRLLGSVAVRLHCPQYGRLYETAARRLTDLDFMSYGSFNARMPEFFDRLGYDVDSAVLRYFGRERQIFWKRGVEGLHCDVFFDQLTFCHAIDLRGRLELDDLTISVSDLLLEKMQIVEINEKDLKDVAILLREHDVADHDRDVVNADYVSQLLSRDWGFWHTCTSNLNKVGQYSSAFTALDEEGRAVVGERVRRLQDAIEAAPKSTSWKLRSKLGTKKKWYRAVEEVDR